ncbi:MAG: hypothetical protein ACXW32_10350, partial [Limisphaerales bacterium]
MAAHCRFLEKTDARHSIVALSQTNQNLIQQLDAQTFDAVFFASDLLNPELHAAIEAARPATSLLFLISSMETFRTELLPAAQNGIVEPTASESDLLQILRTARAGQFIAPAWFFPKLSE